MDVSNLYMKTSNKNAECNNIMKRYNNLYKKVISKDNIFLAIQNARKWKIINFTNSS